MQNTAHSQEAWHAYHTPAGFQPQQAQSEEDFTGVVGGTWDFTQASGQNRIIDHDKPPEWDGEKPEMLARPYVKKLTNSLKTTKVAKKQQGM